MIKNTIWMIVCIYVDVCLKKKNLKLYYIHTSSLIRRRKKQEDESLLIPLVLVMVRSSRMTHYELPVGRYRGQHRCCISMHAFFLSLSCNVHLVFRFILHPTFNIFHIDTLYTLTHIYTFIYVHIKHMQLRKTHEFFR